ncbi:MAG TPA: hypothetical protein VHU84_08725 [Lacipirellulaceae bacterium]|nr:hypothetical protein [Lacipirellulaceae bacterium]
MTRFLIRSTLITGVLILLAQASTAQGDASNWKTMPEFGEASFTTTSESKIRIHVNAPIDEESQPAKATRLIVFALPNGNTLEQTLGCQLKRGMDWHYDIQHIAAQMRLLRTLDPNEKIVLVCAEAPGLSWPSFRKSVPDANAKIGELVASWRDQFGTDKTKVTLAGHSGGGSFMFGVIESAKEIPAFIDRIAFLDSNYSFDAELHAGKLAKWLDDDNTRRLIVVCYDDREITLNGKKVVGPTGGTYRATGRMQEALGKAFTLTNSAHDPFLETSGLGGRIRFYRHPNLDNKILHTVLVGEMNGLLQVATLGTPQEGKWGTFGGPRAYTKYVQAEPTPAEPASPIKTDTSQNDRPKTTPRSSPVNLPPRPIDAIGGAEFAKKIDKMALKDREAAILHEITTGNFPEFLRNFKSVEFHGPLGTGDNAHDVVAKIDVMPDYLAVGSDADFVRMPMTPQTAQQIADRFGCILPTRRLVDAIDSQAELKLAPHPMTEARESIATFVEHNKIIEDQRGNKSLGLLITGVKKDIVLTPRIFEKPQRLAIYGWRQLDGTPIQPLTIVHWNQYVDYSHGVRLVRDTLTANGEQLNIAELLKDPNRCGLVSDEKAMDPPRYTTK